MVVRAPTVLSGDRPRWLAAGVLAAALALWEAYAGELPDLGDRWDVALIALVLIPATFALLWLLLPLADYRGVAAIAAALGVLTVLLSLAGADAAFNVTKLLTYALAGLAFLALFDVLSFVVLIAAIIPLVDIASVYRGPTKVVVEEKPGLFEQLAISFRFPGEDASVHLGPPDVLFFALFLGAASRFGLRVGVTWLVMTGFLSLTLVATYAFDLAGLPALPAISLGFLVANADLLAARWRSYRRERTG